MKEISEPRHSEPHIGESSVIRDFVFGFGDGINTSLGIAAGVTDRGFSVLCTTPATEVRFLPTAQISLVQSLVKSNWDGTNFTC